MNNKELKNEHINDTENHAGYICKLQKDFLQQINRIDLELIYIIKLDNTKDTLNANNKKRNNLSFIKNEKLEKKWMSFKESFNEKSWLLYFNYERYKKAILSILVLVFAFILIWTNFICYALYAIILLLLYIPIMQNGEKMKYITVLHIGHKRRTTRYSKNENNTIMEEISGIEKAKIIINADKLTLNSSFLENISKAELSYIKEVNNSIYNPNISQDMITLLVRKKEKYEKINFDLLSK